MSSSDLKQRITAVLGPTNTGKTYLAIERMLGYRTGMIGFPLRLLARENYDRVARVVGARHVALVTGEEKIVPSTARYFLCTVESMPVERQVDFLAIDEIQLCADRERGYMFTDRLLRARGAVETMFLGADTIRPIVRMLVPEAEFVARPRFSRLSYSGPKKLARIPRRSAVVAFSANDVYAIAEQVRRSRGGAAVVLGALSPRTRNAQVAMYQAGEVDYLVATDAIGMGLNMDINHVAFWRHRKFDGYRNRNLTVQEIAQIAGRAGRHMTDGTFGSIADEGTLPPEVVEAIEEHRFDPVTAVWWRNADLNFRSTRSLLASLEAVPPSPVLMRTQDAEDHVALRRLAGDAETAALAGNPDTVRLLWEVCQIPDFRKTMPEAHVRLLARIFRYLRDSAGKLPTDWVAGQMTQLERTDGDIDTLMARIAHTRTWTFVSHRADWLDDATHWQERARTIEDRLSDALHERLTQRFVDRRSAVLVRSRGKEHLSVEVDRAGPVFVEGEHVGRLEGLRFIADRTGSGDTRRLVAAAAQRALAGEIQRRVERLEAEPDDAFAFAGDGSILWHTVPVARLRGGGDVLSPAIDVPASDVLSPALRQRAEARLTRWLGNTVGTVLAPLVRLESAALSGAARGLAFQLREGLGSISRTVAQAQIAALTAADRKILRSGGVRLGVENVFLPALLKPRAVQLRAHLWAAAHRTAAYVPPAPGLVTAPRDPGVPAEFYAAIGFQPVSERIVRMDMLDRVALRLLRLGRSGPFEAPADLCSLMGLGTAETESVVLGLGYRRTTDGAKFERKRGVRRRPDPAGRKSARKTSPNARVRPERPAAHSDSPFARLADLRLTP